jgi:hypothetical protein
MYLPLGDFCIEIIDDGLRKGRNMQHTCKAQLQQICAVFVGVSVVHLVCSDCNSVEREGFFCVECLA